MEEWALECRARGWLRIAVQLPDELLDRAFEISSALDAAGNIGSDEKRMDVFVLGDTILGSCCADEVAALHHGAELIVHYGGSCLSRPSRIPVKLFLGGAPGDEFDPDMAAEMVLEEIKGTRNVVLARDTRFETNIHRMADALQKLGLDVTVPVVETLLEPSKDQVSECPLLDQLVAEETVVLVAEEDGALAAQAAMRTPNLVIYDPLQGKIVRVKSMLSKRFLKVHQARDAEIIGILVQTTSIAGYIKVLQHLERIIKLAGKKSYTFLVGKVNREKLANFPAVDCFVLVACPLCSILDSKEYLKPIVTPFELEIALQVREWDPQAYSCAFQDLSFETQGAQQSDEPHFSLATGRLTTSSLRKPQDVELQPGDSERSTTTPDPSQGSIVTGQPRHLAIRYSSPAGDFLQTQTFQGLEADIVREPQKATRGQIGTAAGLAPLDAPDRKR